MLAEMSTVKSENVVDELTSGKGAGIHEVVHHHKDDKAPQTPKKGAKKRGANTEETDLSGTLKKVKTSPAKTPKSSKTSTAATTVDDKDGQTNTSPRKRAAAKSGDGIAAGVSIPTNWSTASEADKKLIEMKESGSTWTEIRAMWKELTGQDTAASTLPNRYSRIKVNLEHLEPGDDKVLLAAIARYESQKWHIVSGYMEAAGASKKYAPAFIEKQGKILERHGDTTRVDGPPTTSAKGNIEGKEINKAANTAKKESKHSDEIIDRTAAELKVEEGLDE